MTNHPAFSPLPSAERRAIYRRFRREARMIGRDDPKPVRWLKVAAVELAFYSSMILVAGLVAGGGALVVYLMATLFGLVA